MANVFDEALKLQDTGNKKTSNVFIDAQKMYTPESISTKEPPNIEPSSIGAIAGIGALSVGAGLGVKKISEGISKYREPWNTRNFLINEAQNIQKEIPVPKGVSLEGTKITELPKQVKTGLSVLKSELKNFDNEILSKPIGQISNSIAENYDVFYPKAYESYGKMLGEIDNAFVASGKQITTSMLDDKIIKPTLERYFYSVDTENNPQLKQKINSLKSKIYGANGIKGGKNIDFAQAKQIVSTIREELPKDAQFKFMEKWGKFLEEEAPSGIKEQYRELNKEYKPIAQTRETISKYYDRKTGVFNKAGLNKYISSYIKSNVDTGVRELVEFLGKGNILSSGIPKLTETFSKLTDLQRQRFTEIVEKINKWSKKMPEVESLVSKIKVAQKKIDARAISQKIQSLPVVGKIGQIVNKGLPILGVAGNMAQIGQTVDTINKMKSGQQFFRVDPLTGVPSPMSEDEIKKYLSSLVA